MNGNNANGIMEILKECFWAAYCGAFATAISMMILIYSMPIAFKWMSYLLFPLPVAIGALIRYFRRSRKQLPAYLAWVLPGALFIAAYVNLSRDSLYTHPWTQLLSEHCDETECLYEWFFTVPFLSAIGYSLCALIFAHAHPTNEDVARKD